MSNSQAKMADADKDKKKKKKVKCDTRNYARYYDAPDGCDMPRKIMVTTRYGIVAGLIAGTYDVLMYSHVVGLAPILARYARHVVPIGLMGATFAAVANTVQNAREVDDPLNYFLGGLACGPLVAWYFRSGHGVVAGGICLGLVGVVKKEAVDRDYRFFQKFPNHMNTIGDWRNDWTIVEDPRDALRHTCDEDFDDDDENDDMATKLKKKKKKAKLAKEKLAKEKSGKKVC